MPRDSELVRRYRAAGLVIVGRTNTPEFGLAPVHRAALFGPTRNPWRPTHSPGGSSGGSAAAVAAGMVPVASGGDGGGSIRIPASCCGLFGLKPSRGTHAHRAPSSASSGAASRSSTCSAARCATARPCSTRPPAPTPARRTPRRRTRGRYADEVGSTPEVCASPSRASRCSAGQCTPTACGLAASATLLESLGHHVEEATPPLDGPACARAFVTVLAGELRARSTTLEPLLGRRARAGDFEPATYCLGLLGRALSAADSARRAHAAACCSPHGAVFRALRRADDADLGAPPALIGALQPTAAELASMRGVNALNAGWLLRCARGRSSSWPTRPSRTCRSRRCSMPPANRRCRSRCTGMPRACRSACNWWPSSATMPRCSDWLRSWSRPGPGSIAWRRVIVAVSPRRWTERRSTPVPAGAGAGARIAPRRD